jgi:hypothetical protein
MTDGFVDGKEMEHRVLAGLKMFQRKTVNYVFKRMYEDPDPATRFLIADEVGLGKTLVARGLIARAINHLQASGTKRIDVIYICSNADIAAQNIRRLNVTREHGASRATRITLLPLTLHDLTSNALNFVSFTPGTSFHMASHSGTIEERAVLFRLLQYALHDPLDLPGAYDVLRAYAGEESFRRRLGSTPRVGAASGPHIDRGLADAFRDELWARPDLIRRFRRLVESTAGRGDDANWKEREKVILELRHSLARGCVEALEPDLVILDEFQRFRDLLAEPDPDNPDDIRHLSHHLFKQKNVRTLLLSATPYKMYTLRDEEQDDHYADFLRTARFLMGEGETELLGEDLLAFRRALLDLGGTGDRAVIDRKRRLERRLRRYMVRTERLGVSADRNGMLTDREMPQTCLEPADLRSYTMVDRLSERLQSGDMTDYWKSSPYLLNFMSDYKLKRALRAAAIDPATGPEIASIVDPSTLLSQNRVEAYERLDFGNARLRGLAAETVDADAWRLLWVPASLPYYRGRGAYADHRSRTMTKRLIFSSWNVVPDTVSVLLSYEAERRMMLCRDPATRNTQADRARQRGLLAMRRQEGQPAAMSTFSLLYPSVALAELADPLAIARELGSETREVTADDVLHEATRRVREALAPLTQRARSEGPEDPRWYWAAPLLLDRQRQRTRAKTEAWLASSRMVRSPGTTDGSDDDDTGAWGDHVAFAREVLEQGLRLLHLGRVPADLAHSTALLAIGGPGTCALRAITRVLAHIRRGRVDLADAAARDASLRIAWGFRSLYNVPEVMALLRGPAREEDVYWRRVAEEGLNGNLQAVLDEYVHLLPEWLGLSDSDPANIAERVGETIHETVALRAVNYSPDEVRVDDGHLTFAALHMRVRFALRFGQTATDDQNVLHRSGAVRSAFNSPFWPFVLTSTSVGQEGLDFHQYCHAVVHWNLPANPVDLEQREGRVHRYKGHAIRKNVAERHREAAFTRHSSDPWASMFAEAAKETRHRELRDIAPFWVYEGSAKIERQVPLLPLSREVERLAQLRRSLAAYRLVFGQPRQEDLIAYLGDHVPSEAMETLVQELRIDLTPR